jgi:hypothetical protein
VAVISIRTGWWCSRSAGVTREISTTPVPPESGRPLRVLLITLINEYPISSDGGWPLHTAHIDRISGLELGDDVEIQPAIVKRHWSAQRDSCSPTSCHSISSLRCGRISGDEVSPCGSRFAAGNQADRKTGPHRSTSRNRIIPHRANPTNAASVCGDCACEVCRAIRKRQISQSRNAPCCSDHYSMAGRHEFRLAVAGPTPCSVIIIHH